MTTGPGARGRRIVAGFCAAGFAIAVGALLSAQLSLMSVLDAERAEDAADQIARSRFTTQLIEQTVDRAVSPILGTATASQLATVTSADPRLREVVRSTLIGAHRQVVDPSTAGSTGGDGADDNRSVQSAISQALTDAGAATGVDLSGLDLTTLVSQVPAPSVVPSDLPDFGLRTVAERTRLIAGLSAIVLAQLTLLVHPARGRALRGLAWRAGIVCGTWLVGLLVTGWVIGLVATTLFGEMLQDVWNTAVPSMLLLVAAGVVLSVGLWFAGLAVSGLRGSHAPRDDGRTMSYRAPQSYGMSDPYDPYGGGT